MHSDGGQRGSVFMTVDWGNFSFAFHTKRFLLGFITWFYDLLSLKSKL